jgi:hypothetical protein
LYVPAAGSRRSHGVSVKLRFSNPSCFQSVDNNWLFGPRE